MEIKIESGIAIPELPKKGLGVLVRSMKVGDSFWVAERKKVNSATSALRGVGFRASQRAVTENGVAGFRVWRTA